MKKMILILLLSALWAMPACNNNNSSHVDEPVAIMADTLVGEPLYDTLNLDPVVLVKENSFIIIAKALCMRGGGGRYGVSRLLSCLRRT